MKEIITIIKDKDKVYFTFTEDVVRLKMPAYFLTTENHDFCVNIVRRLEPYIYKDFVQTLRGQVSIENLKKFTFSITFRTWDQLPDKIFSIKKRSIKIKHFRRKKETRLQYIKRRIKHAI